LSKAFVKEDVEDDDSLEDQDTQTLAGLAGIPKNYMTPRGHQNMKSELLNLLNVERPEMTISMVSDDYVKSIVELGILQGDLIEQKSSTQDCKSVTIKSFLVQEWSSQEMVVRQKRLQLSASTRLIQVDAGSAGFRR
jgi:hypothetical protein